MCLELVDEMVVVSSEVGCLMAWLRLYLECEMLAEGVSCDVRERWFDVVR